MQSLAIVIPAHKGAFLSRTLECLVNQTNKEFTVYIGNDAGEAGIEDIVSRYKDHLDIRYQYFDDNLGRLSLVKQWERCFALVQNEEWLWLLPDDDYADPQCVELFYDQLEKRDFDLFRFNVHFVNADESIFKTNPALPGVQDAFDSLMEKLSFTRPSTVAEFIFNKMKFESIGFTEIPMAWGTDDLLWYMLGKDKGIRNCNEAFVYLRQSHLNISNNYCRLGKKKIKANFEFFSKLLHTELFKSELAKPEKKKLFRDVAINHIFYNLQDFGIVLKPKDIFQFALNGNRIWGGGIIKNIHRFNLSNKRILKRSNKSDNE
jgi:hypothetical protein